MRVKRVMGGNEHWVQANARIATADDMGTTAVAVVLKSVNESVFCARHTLVVVVLSQLDSLQSHNCWGGL